METSRALIKRPRLSYKDRYTTRSILNKANFPHFDDGDVIIQLRDEDSLWTLRLHRAELEADSLPMVLLSSEGSLQGGPEGFAFQLTLTSPSTDFPVPYLTMRKRERPVSLTDVCIAYRSFFANIYGQSLLVSSTDILLVQRQAEILIHIANHYGTLDKLRPHLISHFSNFHMALFQSIALNLPRWLNLADALHCEAMYREALVHLIGMYPKHTWWAETERTIPPQLLDTIRAKGQALQHQVETCIIQLFHINLGRRTARNPTGSGPGPAMTLSPQSVERFFLVHLHNEWLRTQLDAIETYDNQHAPHPPPAPNFALRFIHRDGLSLPLPAAPPRWVGILLRAIAGDADDYMLWDRVRASLMESLHYFVDNTQAAGLERDLRNIKAQARNITTRMGLARRNLVVDEEMARGLTYLVCAGGGAGGFDLARGMEGWRWQVS